MEGSKDHSWIVHLFWVLSRGDSNKTVAMRTNIATMNDPVNFPLHCRFEFVHLCVSWGPKTCSWRGNVIRHKKQALVRCAAFTHVNGQNSHSVEVGRTWRDDSCNFPFLIFQSTLQCCPGRHIFLWWFWLNFFPDSIVPLILQDMDKLGDTGPCWESSFVSTTIAFGGLDHSHRLLTNVYVCTPRHTIQTFHTPLQTHPTSSISSWSNLFEKRIALSRFLCSVVFQWAMSDGIQLRDIRATTTDLPPPAYVNPAFGQGHGTSPESTQEWSKHVRPILWFPYASPVLWR